MQKFVNNWSASLQAPLLAADLSMQLPPALAALLLMEGGDYYDLTIGPLSPAPEIVRVVGVVGDTATLSERGLEGTYTAAEWPAGTDVQCCVTAGMLERLHAGGGEGGVASGFVVAQPGANIIPASAGLIYVHGYDPGYESAELILPTPADGQAISIDVQLMPSSLANGPPPFEVVFVLDGGTAHQVDVRGSTVDVADDAGVLQISVSEIQAVTFCRLVLINDGGEPSIDLVSYYADA